MAKIRNSRGSTIIEALATIALFQLLLAVGLPLVYFAYAHLWTQFQSQEALACLASRKAPVTCQRQLEHRLSAGLPFGKTDVRELNQVASNDLVKVEFKLTPKLVFLIQQSMEAPHAQL